MHNFFAFSSEPGITTTYSVLSALGSDSIAQAAAMFEGNESVW